MIVKFKILLLGLGLLVLVVGLVLSALGESRRSVAFLRPLGLVVFGVALGALIAIAMAS